MADERIVLKSFLDTLSTENLLCITRSIYHGGGIKLNSREEAEALLLSQESWRVLSCKKTPLKSILLFLFKHGINVPPDVNKIQAIEYFKMLLNPNALQVPNLVQPGILQNMRVQAIQPAPPTDSNNVLEDFIKMFAKHFYELLNNMGLPGKQQLDNRYFFENSSMSLIIASSTEEINEQYQDTTSVLQGLLDIKNQHQVFFSPYLGDQVKWKKESHGLLKVQIGGTLHQGVGRMVGVFDQAFILREDPIAQHTWKILNIKFYLKSLVEVDANKCITY